MGYSELVVRIVEWPREDGSNVRALGAADKMRHGRRVRVRVRLRRPKAHEFRNGVSSADRSRQEVVRPANPCLYSNNCLPFHSQAFFCPFLFFVWGVRV